MCYVTQPGRDGICTKIPLLIWDHRLNCPLLPTKDHFLAYTVLELLLTVCGTYRSITIPPIPNLGIGTMS
jgi:hypothetical protein